MIRMMSNYQIVMMVTWFSFGHGLNVDLEITVNFPFYSRSYLFSTSALRSFRDCTCSRRTSSCTLSTEEQDDYTFLVQSIDRTLTVESPSKFVNRYRCHSPYRISCERLEVGDDEDDVPLFYISDASCGLQCVGISWPVGQTQTAQIYNNTAYLFRNTCVPDTCEAYSVATKSTFQDCPTETAVSPKTVSTTGASTTRNIVWNTTNVYPQNKDGDDGTINTSAVIGITIGIIATLAFLVVVLYFYKRRMRKKNETQNIHQEDSHGFVTAFVPAEINEKNAVNAYTEINEGKFVISSPDEDYETINENPNSETNDVSKSSRQDYQNDFIWTSEVEDTKLNNVEVGSVKPSSVASQMFINKNGVDSQTNSDIAQVFDITAQKSDLIVSHLESKSREPRVHDQVYFIIDKHYSDDQPETLSFDHDVSHHSATNHMARQQPAASPVTMTKQIYSKLGERNTDFKDTYNTKSGSEPGMVASLRLDGHIYLNDRHTGHHSHECVLDDASTSVYGSSNNHVTAEDVEADEVSSDYDLASE